jgi:hypothetical protein
MAGGIIEPLGGPLERESTKRSGDDEGITVVEEAVEDLSELGVKETPPTIVDRTRAHIARTLTYATIGSALVLVLALAVLIGRLVVKGEADEKDIQRIQPLITLLISQTLVPLTTIAITWYFASRSAEERARERDNNGK